MTELQLDDYPRVKRFLKETGMTIDQAYTYFKNQDKN